MSNGKHKKWIAAALSGVLLLGAFGPMAPQVLAAENEETAEIAGSTENWAENIPSLLAAGEYEEGVVVVGIDRSLPAPARNRGVDGAVINSGTEKILEVAEEHVITEDAAKEDLTKAEDASKAGALTGSDDVTETGSDTVSIEIASDSSKTTEELLYELAKDPRVVFAEPNYLAEESSEEEQNILASYVDDVLAEESEIADLTPLQWGCWDGIGTVRKDTSKDASIHVPTFGPTGRNMTGDPIVVAVLDYPVDYTNQDLSDRIYRFSKSRQELLGCDEYGYNACWQSADGKPDYFGGSHGTHCAGIIGASWDGHGTSGVASNTKIVSVQVALIDGRTSLVNILRGFAFVKNANENGVGIRVTSNSYGLVQYSTALDAAIRELGEEYGTVSVFAAGNSNKDLGLLTAVGSTLEDNPYAIVVAATDQSEKRAGFSNYGEGTVDLGAPGVSILSTVTTDCVSYLPDAVPGSNLRYEGFEGEVATDVAIRAVAMGNETVEPYADGTPQQTAEGEPYFLGEHSAKLTLPSGTANARALEFQLGDVSDSEERLYFGLSYYQPDRYTTVRFHAKGKDGSYEELKRTMNDEGGSGSGWHAVSVMLEDSTDLSDLDIVVTLGASDSAGEFYIDSVGLGTKCVPYAYMSGTSMACPMVSGAVAVLAADRPELSGLELASLVKSSVRPATSMKGITKTGGVIDFEAVTGLRSPVITDLGLQDGVLEIKGSGFGETIGRIRVIRRSVGTDPVTLYDSSKAKNKKDITWNDTSISLPYAGTASGVVQVLVENASGRSGSRELLLGRGDNVYEKELPNMDEYAVFRLPDEGAGRADLDTAGTLTGFGDKLYYIPTSTLVEEQPVSKRMFIYDPQNEYWDEGPELPEPLCHISSAIYEQRLYVMGESAAYYNGEIGYYNDCSTMRVYVYNPELNQWIKVSAEGVQPGQSIVNYNEELFVVGGTEVALYSPYEGADKAVVSLREEINWPSLAAKGDCIYVYDAQQYRFGVIQERAYQDLSGTLPEIMNYTAGREEENYWMRQGTLLAVSDGILLVGPAEKSQGTDKVISDTFLLREGASKFESWPKRMSEDKVKASAAASYRGWVYAIGTATLEPGESFFRATAMEVDEYYGDIPRKEDTLKWKHNSKGWWMEYPDGTYPKSEWIQVKGKWYYFAEDGYMAVNEWRDGRWLGKNGAWTYEGTGTWKSNKYGRWYEDSLGWYPVSRWQKIDGKWYYFNKNGYVVTGWQQLSGKWYFFNKDGSMKTGWKKSGGKWYYLGADGAMVTAKTLRMSGKVTYEFDENGVCVNP